MKWIFWISLLFIGYTYVGYPLWLYLRTLWQPRPWRQVEGFPSVSVVMAVRNEAERIEQKLHNLFELDYPSDRLEIIVISDGSQDSTPAILTRYPKDRLRVIHHPEHQGKAAALNAGIREARGEIVVFVDVRQQLDTLAVRYLVSNFADPSVGCAAGDLVLRQGDRPFAFDGIGFYWRYERWTRKCQATIGSTVGVFGPIYAVRRRLLVPLPEGTILDDVYLPLHVVRQGYRSIFDSRACAWDSPSPSNGAEFRRKVRTLTGNYQLLQLAPWLLRRENPVRFHFVSHKLLRLSVPLFLACLFLSSWWLAKDKFYLGLALLQSTFYLFAALGLQSRVKPLRRLLGFPAAFCLLNGAALMGLVNFLFRRSPLWQVWVPADYGRQWGRRK